LQINTSSFKGIYNNSGNKWLCYADANNNQYFNGNANTATKATQDGNGANIASTYLKLSGGTVTGHIYGIRNLYGSGYGTVENIISAISSDTVYFGPGGGLNKGTTVLRGQTVRLYSHTSNHVYLGSSGTTVITSDEHLKDISDIDDKYIKFYNNLKPILYKYTTPTSDRSTHIGFGARQVEKALHNAGLTNKDFSGLIRDENVTIQEDEWGEKGGKHFDVLYSLGYDEFIALNTKMIQKCLKEIEELKDQINKLKGE
jgi:hypothetical protein